MAGNSVTIWGTLEAHCWAGGFKYEEYEEIFKKQLPSHTPLCKEAFELMCKMFDAQYKHDVEVAEANRDTKQTLEGF